MCWANKSHAKPNYLFEGVTTVGNAMNGDDLRHNWIQKDN
jgi:hypothetical protein